MKIVNPIAVMGENVACSYLIKQGYIIRERNFRKSYGEIDIIAQDGKELVFIEVKTRTNRRYGVPFESISHSKLKSITKSAQFYACMLHPEFSENYRIDAIGVSVDDGAVTEIEHLKSIFLM